GATTWAASAAVMLAGVLIWLMFFHLPSQEKRYKERDEAKDKHNRDLIDANLATVDRLLNMMVVQSDKEAKARHDMRDEFQGTMLKVEADHRQDFGIMQGHMKAMQDQHRADAEKDREAFEKRA